jgi:hypothetical protein
VRVEGWLPVLRALLAEIAREPEPTRAPAALDPLARIERHLAEGLRAHLEQHWAVAAAHYRAARREVEALEKEIADSIPY